MSDLRIERVFEADVESVFEFVTQTRHLLEWWGPEGMTIPVHDLNLSRPGPWHSTMMNSDGGKFKVSGEVLSVDTPNSVSFTWAWHDEAGARGHDSRVRIELETVGDATRFTLTHSGLVDQPSIDSHREGWGSSISKLEEKLPLEETAA